MVAKPFPSLRVLKSSSLIRRSSSSLLLGFNSRPLTFRTHRTQADTFCSTTLPINPRPSLNGLPAQYLSDHLINITPLRRLWLIYGLDTFKFINGLCTSSLLNFEQLNRDSNLSHLKLVDGLYTCFLNPQGRILFDAFIYNARVTKDTQSTRPELLLDVGAEMREQVISHLNRYKLLARVKVEDVTSRYSVLNLAGPHVFTRLNGPSTDTPLKGFQVEELGAEYGAWDHRFRSPELGVRLIIPNERRAQLTSLNVTELPTCSYEQKLIHLGIAETNRGMVSTVSLPMECNLELLNGIHFRKGCYIGQELTIRTHHKGVVRKRLLPARVVAREACLTQLVGVDLYLPRGTDQLKAKCKPIGKVVWMLGHRALILARLELLPDPTSELLTCEVELGEGSERISLEFFYPPWIRALTA